MNRYISARVIDFPPCPYFVKIVRHACQNDAMFLALVFISFNTITVQWLQIRAINEYLYYL